MGRDGRTSGDQALPLQNSQGLSKRGPTDSHGLSERLFARKLIADREFAAQDR